MPALIDYTDFIVAGIADMENSANIQVRHLKRPAKIL